MPRSCSGRAGRLFVRVAVLGWLLICSALAAIELGYTTKVSEALIARLERSFGAAARPRLAGWRGFAREQKRAPVAPRLSATTGLAMEALQAVNSYFNRIRFVDDSIHWGQDDYWATPAETVASDGGDCEDFAIVKYFFLKELGVPIERLRITYVRALKLNQAHMVLAYYVSPEAEPLILDNLVDRIRAASDRVDLDPVFSFNDDDVRMVADGQRAKPAQIREWRSLLDRLAAQATL